MSEEVPMETDQEEVEDPQSISEEIPSDNLDDVETFSKMSKELEVSCNVLMSRKNFLFSKIIALSADAERRPVNDADGLLQSACVPVLGNEYVKSLVLGQAINKLNHYQISSDQYGQLESAIFENMMESLIQLEKLSQKVSEALKKLNAKREKKEELTKKFRQLSNAFQERLIEDSVTREKESDKPTLADFKKKYKKKCSRISMFQTIITLLISRSNINYLKHPEFITLLKKCHKSFDIEILLEKLRGGEFQEE
ncbi:Hypothetical predicted protein [Cloeon dipterum]|uniref:Uncharacterized protein n=1 Tax=Cloeon dipterum TaxID=197152 RepID=A0A8S1D0U2_9INSE|nr:Hypothetical predicted protein [Cloeon dipterum]CAB3383058.1 Hypothetical predicted protein [Cloeon dipterum]